jgi:hypothetical protein
VFLKLSRLIAINVKSFKTGISEIKKVKTFYNKFYKPWRLDHFAKVYRHCHHARYLMAYRLILYVVSNDERYSLGVETSK